MFNLDYMNRLNIYLTSCAIFISILFSFSQNEKQLAKQFIECKDLNKKVQLGAELLSFYANHNSQRREKLVEKLNKIEGSHLDDNSLKLLNLLRAEEFISKNNIDDFSSLFSNKLSNVKFNDPLFQLRKNKLQLYYDLYILNTEYHPTLKKNLDLTLKTRKNKLISESMQFSALVYSWKQEKDSARYYASQAILYAKRSDSKITLANSFKTFASVYSFFNDYQQAMLKELDFLQIAKELKNDYLKAIAYRDIAFISMNAGNHAEASIYFKRALQLSNEVFSEFDRGIIYLGLARNDFDLGNFYLARNNLKLAESVFKKYNSMDYLAKVLLIQGLLETSKTNSCNYFIQGLKKFERSNCLEGIIESSYFLALQYTKINEFNKALPYLYRSLELSNSLNEKSFFSLRNRLLLAQILESQGKINEAYRAQKMIVNLNQNYTVRKEAVKIAQLTESNLREEREQLIEFQKEAIEKEKKLKENLEVQRSKNFLIAGFIVVLLIFGIIILFLRMNQNRLKQEQRAAEMSQTLLRTQMNPHFVFNAMSAIQSYIFTHNPERSSRFLVNFSKLMRLILENSPKEFIPLELEAEILEKYLNTQKMRFEDRFEYEILFDEKLLFKKALVPPMITQPFVENAIEHGQLHTIDQGKITISAEEKAGMLLIIIQDNGIGRKHSAMTQKIKKHKSMAIDITRERISIINNKYKTEGSLTFEDNDKTNEKGTIVKILLPLQFEN